MAVYSEGARGECEQLGSPQSLLTLSESLGRGVGFSFRSNENQQQTTGLELALLLIKHQCVGKGGAEVARPLEVQESGLRISFALSVSALGTIFSSAL